LKPNAGSREEQTGSENWRKRENLRRSGGSSAGTTATMEICRRAALQGGRAISQACLANLAKHLAGYSRVKGVSGVSSLLRSPHSSTVLRYATATKAKADGVKEKEVVYAEERTRVHGLGRLAAKLGKPVVDVCKLDALPRNTQNKYAIKRLREEGLVPAVLMPLKNTQKNGTLLLSLQTSQVKRLLRRHKTQYAKTQLIKLVVPEGSDGKHFEGWVDGPQGKAGAGGDDAVPIAHAVFRSFDFHPVTSDILSVTLQRCPPKGLVKVRLPLSIIGGDACPAMKQNGYLYPVRPFVDCVVESDDIPESIEYNISRMTIGQSIRIRDLVFHDSIKRLLGKSADPAETLYKMIKL